MSVIPDRLQHLDTLSLDHGSHASFEAGHCAMEAVAWLTGEPHTDHPACVSPVIGAFLRRWNDDLDADGRQILKPLLPKVIGTFPSTPELEEQRAWLVTDWLVRVHTPAWLELAGITESASALRALPELTAASVRGAHPAIEDAKTKAAAAWAAARDAARAAARDAARAAAWDAAGDAAWDAARDAARAAARAAARDAARDAARAAARDAARDAARAAAWDAAGAAAWAAAWDAAGDAAWDAAWDAAGDAAWDALKPTTTSLQASAVDLVERLAALR